MESDKAAIEAIMQGDRDRFAVLVERHKRMVYAIAWSRLGDADLCEDAAQETFLRAFRYLRALRDMERFPAWLSRIARNVSGTFLRRRRTELENRKRWQIEQPSSVTPSPREGNEEDPGDTLSRTLAELPPLHRESLVLYYLEGKSIAEAASVLGISETAMKTRLHRARLALRGRLEQEIERGLDGLGPRQGFAASVMLLLPPKPLGVLAAGGGASLIGKAGSWLAGLVPGAAFALWAVLGQATFIYLIQRGLARMQNANIVDKPENEFRKAIPRRNALTVTLRMLITLAAFYVAFFLLMSAGLPIGLPTMFQALAIYSVLGVYQSLRFLRVNRSAYAVGQTLASVFFVFVFCLVAFFSAPFTIFVAGLLFMNIVLVITGRQTPLRQDYNLFLREANGSLGEFEPGLSAPHRLTQSELRAFARFLGEQWLVRDYSIRGASIQLRLPPVQPGLFRSFLGSTAGPSTIRVGANGECRPSLARSDAKAIGRLTGHPADAGSLETGVARVVQGALASFLNGRPAAAEEMLTTVDDSQIFIHDIGKAKAHRARFGVAIVSLVLLLAFFCPPVAWHFRFFTAWRPRPVTQAMMRDAVAEWSVKTDRATQSSFSYLLDSDFSRLWDGPIHPSLALMCDDHADAYRNVVHNALKMEFDDRQEGVDLARIVNALMRPRLLYHAFATPILSTEELQWLGFEPERVRQALLGWRADLREKLLAPEKWSFQRNMNRRWMTTETFKTLNIEPFAVRLRVLEHFGCLDLVDRDAIVQTIASHQVTPEFRLADGFSPVDLAQAAGLFDFGMCNLKETWAGLSALETLGQMHRIDREACVQGILRFYRGKGVFRAGNPLASGVLILGQDDDAFYAMESLALLNALGRIPDLQKWQFHPVTQTVTVNGQARPGVVTFNSLLSWAYQERLEAHRAAAYRADMAHK
jgi:RNA polymerase sigma-70 factor (ECF subfamily)